MTGPSTTSTRGILNPTAARAHFSLTRHAPAADLSRWIERHWIVRWDLRGREPFTQEILPHPSVNLVFEPGLAAVHGVVSTRRFRKSLADAGIAIGTKFRPGGFHGFISAPISELTDRVLPLTEAFGAAGAELERAWFAADGDAAAERIELVESFLRSRLPPPDPDLDLVTSIVQQMLTAPLTTRVADIAAANSMSPRTLQRLFREYVGVTPKWVLKRYRLHEAAERAADNHGRVDWASLALELGYFDQAHFIKDFSALIGRSPVEYAAACAAM